MAHDVDRRQADLMKRLLVISTLVVVLAGCSVSADRAVRAYDACVARHHEEMMICEAPRQAYEADTTTFQARIPDAAPPAW
jgi:Tfp pilus assembly protein PilP